MDIAVLLGRVPRGLLRRLMSFVGLLGVTDKVMMLKEMVVHNTPRFEYRGHQVEVTWNLRSKEVLRKTTDAMEL